MKQENSAHQAIKTAIVGFGNAAKIMHAPFLLSMPSLYRVDVVLERHRTESASVFPEAEIMKTIEDVLASDAELIIITTPNDSHVDYAAAALNAGKHVVVDKPFTIHSVDARKLIKLAAVKNRILSVYQNRRYSSDFKFIRDVLSQNILGEVHSYETHYHRYRAEAKPGAWREKPEEGAGILYDLGAHLIDQATVLFGNPKMIYAETKLQRPHAKAVDWFEVYLDFGYTKATLKGGMLVKEPGPRFEIHGTVGSLLKYGEDAQETALKAGKIPACANDNNWGRESSESYAIIHTLVNGEPIRKLVKDFQGNFGVFYAELYNSIRNGAALSVTAEQAFNTVRLIELAIESSEKGKKIPCSGLI